MGSSPTDTSRTMVCNRTRTAVAFSGGHSVVGPSCSYVRILQPRGARLMEHFNEAKVVWSLAEWEPDEEKLRALVDEVIGLLDRALAGQLDSLAQAAC
eukprot:COSAG01_NODE_41428_length_451_cov_3.821023_1_plen_97_part_01